MRRDQKVQRPFLLSNEWGMAESCASSRAVKYAAWHCAVNIGTYVTLCVPEHICDFFTMDLRFCQGTNIKFCVRFWKSEVETLERVHKHNPLKLPRIWAQCALGLLHHHDACPFWSMNDHHVVDVGSAASFLSLAKNLMFALCIKSQILVPMLIACWQTDSQKLLLYVHERAALHSFAIGTVSWWSAEIKIGPIGSTHQRNTLQKQGAAYKKNIYSTVINGVGS